MLEIIESYLKRPRFSLKSVFNFQAPSSGITCQLLQIPRRVDRFRGSQFRGCPKQKRRPKTGSC